MHGEADDDPLAAKQTDRSRHAKKKLPTSSSRGEYTKKPAIDSSSTELVDLTCSSPEPDNGASQYGLAPPMTPTPPTFMPTHGSTQVRIVKQK